MGRNMGLSWLEPSWQPHQTNVYKVFKGAWILKILPDSIFSLWVNWGFPKWVSWPLIITGKTTLPLAASLSCTPGREMAFHEKGQTLARELRGWASGAVWVQGPSAQICTCAPTSQRAACHGQSWTPPNTKPILLRGAEWECFWTSSQNCERWDSPPWGDEEGGTDWAQLTDVMFISEMVRERQAGGRCTRCLWSQEKWPR